MRPHCIGGYHVLGKQENASNDINRGTGMVKCRVCARKMCAPCHNLETIRESAPPHPEMIHPADEDHDPEMPDHDTTATHSAPLGDEAPWPILGRQKELAEKNISNRITFIPHRMRKR